MRFAKFITRSGGFSPDELEALVTYLKSIPLPPNPYRSPDGKLTPAQERGKLIFERTMTNDRRPILPEGRCITCHSPPFYTNGRSFDVGTKKWYDTSGTFDTPQLNNIYDSAPYLHDGSAVTLEEIWTVYGTEDLHGIVNDLTKEQLNDLIEYLKSL
jgi:cytochrome c peroxidase